MSKKFEQMGQFAREEMVRRGLKFAQIARNLGISRQALDYRFGKDEWSLSEMQAMISAVGDPGFFDTYFEEIPGDRKNPLRIERAEVSRDQQRSYQELAEAPKKGYRISVEIDPDDFNPQEWDQLSEALKEMMDKLK